jgi:hypothetical protein
MFELEAFVDCQEDVKPALNPWDENVISLASPSQISDGLDSALGKSQAKMRCEARIDALVDQDTAHSATRSCTNSR